MFLPKKDILSMLRTAYQLGVQQTVSQEPNVLKVEEILEGYINKNE